LEVELNSEQNSKMCSVKIQPGPAYSSWEQEHTVTEHSECKHWAAEFTDYTAQLRHPVHKQSNRKYVKRA